jgi:hypothetical protein
MSGQVGTFRIGVTQIGAEYMLPYTPADIIKLALKGAGLLGVGQTALDEDTMDAFNALNGMIGQWQRKRWLIWHLLDIGFTTNSGAQTYTVGPGGDFDIPRPDRIEFAYFRQFTNNSGNAVDFPLMILESMEDYAQIALKSLQSWPQAVFYDAAVPNGILYPVPIPNILGAELHIGVKDTLSQFSNMTDAVSLPPEYFEALWSNLALRVAALFPGSDVTEFTIGIAKASLATIRGANAQIPRLQMPTGLVRPPLFNIYSYQTY